MKLLIFILAFISTQAFAHKVESYHPTYLSHSCIYDDAQIEVDLFELNISSLYTDGDDVYNTLSGSEKEIKHIPKDLIERMKKIWVKACIHHRKHYSEEECGGEGLSKKKIEKIVEICELEPIDWGYRLLGGLFIFDKEEDKEKDKEE